MCVRYKRLASLYCNPLISQGLSDSVYYFLAQSGSKLLSLAVLPLLARRLTVEEFAAYDLFLLVTGLLTTIAGLGMDSGLAVLMAENKEHEETLSFIFSWSLLISSGVIILLWMVAIILEPLWAKTILRFLQVNYVFPFLLGGYITYYVFSFLRWLGKARLASLLSFISATSGVCTGGVLLQLTDHPSLEKYLFGLVIGNIAGAVVSLVLCARYLNFSLIADGYGILLDLFKLSLPFVPTYLASYLMTYSDRYLVGSLLSPHDLGVYAMAARIGQIPNFFVGVISRGILPLMYRNIYTDEGRAFTCRIMHAYLYSFIPLLLSVFVLGRSLIQEIAGTHYLESLPILPIMIMAVMYYGILSLDGFGYSVQRKTIYISYISIGITILNLALGYFLAQRLGIRGIAYAGLLSSMIGSCIYVIGSESLFKIGYSQKLITLVAILVLISLMMAYYIG